MIKYCPACESETEWLGKEGDENCDKCGRVMSLAELVAKNKVNAKRGTILKRIFYGLIAIFTIFAFIFIEIYESGSIEKILFDSTAKVTGLFIFGLLVLFVIKIFKKIGEYLQK